VAFVERFRSGDASASRKERQGVDAETNRALMKAYQMEVVGPPLE
jgi:hypothetical protein